MLVWLAKVSKDECGSQRWVGVSIFPCERFERFERLCVQVSSSARNEFYPTARHRHYCTLSHR
jgi:hypothetical protein